MRECSSLSAGLWLAFPSWLKTAAVGPPAPLIALQAPSNAASRIAATPPARRRGKLPVGSVGVCAGIALVVADDFHFRRIIQPDCRAVAVLDDAPARAHAFRSVHRPRRPPRPVLWPPAERALP